MRAPANNPAAPYLQRRSVTEHPDGSKTHSYEVFPVEGPMGESWGTLDPGDECSGDSLEAVLSCLRRGIPSLVVTSCAPVAPTYANELHTCCDTSFYLGLGAGSRSCTENGLYLGILGIRTTFCERHPVLKSDVVVCPGKWHRGPTCQLPRTEQVWRCWDAHKDQIEEAHGWRLILSPVQPEDGPPVEPSPRPRLAQVTAVPVTITLRRPQSVAQAAETQRVEVKLDVTPNSGGMIDAAGAAPGLRPRGWLMKHNDCRGPTGFEPPGRETVAIEETLRFRKGETEATARACLYVSEYSGDYRLDGRCLDKPDCDRREAERPFRLAVNETLIDLRTSAIANEVVFVGATDFAPENHYFNADRFAQLQQIVTTWNANCRPDPQRPGQYLDPLLRLNDASLVWGGKFSDRGTWRDGGHVTHRRGRELDVRTRPNADHPIPLDREEYFRQIVRERNARIEIHPPHATPTTSGRHFHIYF